MIYQIKECVDDFCYTYQDTSGNKRVIKLTEKRVVTYNPKLAEKQKYEINKQVEKAKLLKASEAKKTEYGDSAKYVSFVAADKKGTKTDGKIKVEMNDKAIERARELAVKTNLPLTSYFLGNEGINKVLSHRF